MMPKISVILLHYLIIYIFLLSFFLGGETMLCFIAIFLVSFSSIIYADSSSNLDALSELESLVRTYHNLKRKAHDKIEKKRVVSKPATIEGTSGSKHLDVKTVNKYLDELLRRYSSLLRAKQTQKQLASTLTVKPANPLSRTKTATPTKNPESRSNVIDATRNNVFDIPGRDCGLKTRLAYRKCLITANSENHLCARQFVGDYPSCFFHNMTRGIDAYGCMRTCISQFDQCMYFSTKPEVMVCMQARGVCAHNCPATNGQVVKRGCYEDCAGYFQVCEQLVTQTEDLYICKENERQCKERCAEAEGR